MFFLVLLFDDLISFSLDSKQFFYSSSQLSYKLIPSKYALLYRSVRMHQFSMTVELVIFEHADVVGEGCLVEAYSSITIELAIAELSLLDLFCSLENNSCHALLAL